MKKPSAEKIGKKKYELQVQEKVGIDGVPEDHFTFHGATGKIMSLPKNLKCRNVMSAKDRKRLGK